ncbi:MAG: hypothetical protein ACXWXO_08725 [Nocardioides sp.]
MRLNALMAPWRSWCGLVAVLVVALDVVGHGLLLANGFFGQNDFLVMNDATRQGAHGLLEADHTGAFAPGATLLAWALVSVAPLSWGVAIAPVLLFRTASAVVLWLLLTRLLGERWLRLPLLVLFCSTPLTLWATQWWWVGIRFWPASLALLVACWALVARVQRGGGRRLEVAVLGSLVVALCFSPLAVLDVLVLFGLALVVLPGETLGARVRASLELRRLGAGVVLVLVAYGVLLAFVAPIGPPPASDIGEIVTRHLRYLAAELWGGPWTGKVAGHAALVPHSWAVAVGGALLLAVVGATLQAGGATARAAWLLFGAHSLASAGLAAWLSEGSAFDALGMVPRVAAGTAPVFVVCLAGALATLDLDALTAGLAVRGRALLAPGVAEPVLAALASVALVASALVSTRVLAPNLFHEEARDYVTTLRSALADDPRTVLHDSTVPSQVIDPLFGNRARVSEVVGPAPERPLIDVATSRLRVVSAEGTIVEPELEVAGSAVPAGSPECRYPVRAGRTTIPLTATLSAQRWVARIGYYTSAESFVDLRAAGREIGFAVSPGLHIVYVPFDGEVDGVTLSLAAAEGTLCVTDLDVGTPVGAVR